MHRVDAVALLPPFDLRSPATGTEDVRTEMKLVGPGRVLLNSTTRTFENSGIVELLQETPMDAAQGLPTLNAMVHSDLCYSAIGSNATRSYRAKLLHFGAFHLSRKRSVLTTSLRRVEPVICYNGRKRVTMKNYPFAVATHYARPDHGAWRAPAQPEEYRCRNSA